MSMLAAAATALTLTVRVYDLYGVTAADRARGIELAQATLAHAGVATVWIDCTRRPGVEQPARCTRVLETNEVVLRFQKTSPRGEHILGTAVVQADGPNVFASIYAQSISARSVKTGIPESTILGRVMAHEIGHLLLGTNSHAPTGLMKASWHLRSPHPDEWLFTPNDADKIRRRAIRPVEPDTAPATVTF
jgi:hypothetical protein